MIHVMYSVHFNQKNTYIAISLQPPAIRTIMNKLVFTVLLLKRDIESNPLFGDAQNHGSKHV